VALAVSPGSGNILLVWEDTSTPDPEIRGRILTASNNLYSSEFAINTLTNGAQLFPDACATTNGFLVTFQTQSFGTNGFQVAARRFLSDGTPVDAQEFCVNSNLLYSALHPIAGLMTNGNFWIAFEKSNGTNQDIYIRSYTGLAVPIQSNDAVWISGAGDQGAPAAARLNDGRFVFAYEDRETAKIEVRLANPAVTAIMLTNGTLLTNNWSFSSPSVAALSDGGFVMVCEAETNNTAASRAVVAQIYNSNGVARTATVLGSHTQRWEQPRVAGMPYGGFVAAWQTTGTSGDSASEFAVFSARFSSNGIPANQQHIVHEVNTSDQEAAAVVSFADGRHLIAWQSFGQDATNGFGIFSDNISSPMARGPGLSLSHTGDDRMVQLSGIPREIYTVETSTNLTTWSLLLVTNTPTGLATWFDLAQTNQLYFRAWSRP